MKFHAFNGYQTIVLLGHESRQAAIAYFEECFSLENRHWAWEYKIVEIKEPDRESEIEGEGLAPSVIRFLRQAGAEGGRLSRRKKSPQV